MNHLSLEQILRAHVAYQKILDGFQQAQRGFEDLMESKLFEKTPSELEKIVKAIRTLTAQSSDMAKAKGVLMLHAKNIDILSQRVQDNLGDTWNDPNPS